MTINIAELVGEFPLPGRRQRVRRSPELEAAILECARQGFPVLAIAGALGIPATTIHGWARKTGTFGPRFRDAVEEGRRLNTEVDKAMFIAGARRLRAVLPKRRWSGW